jgi:hypothetical protein
VKNETFRRMSAKDYLYEKGRDFLERAYRLHAGGRYSHDSDGIVAEKLSPFAVMDGVETRLTADTLGKARSRFGLVSKKSPRPSVVPARPASNAPQSMQELLAAVVSQPELPHVHEDGAERAGWAMVKQQKRTNELLVSLLNHVTTLLMQRAEIEAAVHERCPLPVDTVGEPS